MRKLIACKIPNTNVIKIKSTSNLSEFCLCVWKYMNDQGHHHDINIHGTTSCYWSSLFKSARCALEIKNLYVIILCNIVSQNSVMKYLKRC